MTHEEIAEYKIKKNKGFYNGGYDKGFKAVRLATIKEERERILNLLTYYGKWLNMSNKRIFRIDLDEIKAKELLGAE